MCNAVSCSNSVQVNLSLVVFSPEVLLCIHSCVCVCVCMCQIPAAYVGLCINIQLFIAFALSLFSPAAEFRVCRVPHGAVPQ